MAKDITFRILAQDLASPAFRSVAASAEAAGLKIDAAGHSGSTGMSGLSKFAAGAALALGVTAVKSVQLAAQFQSSMEHLHTQAGVAQSSIKGLSNEVLNLAGQVGVGPNSLAQSLYHIESTFEKTGLGAAKAKDLLKTAAEGAKIGGSDLVDTTNALDAAVVSGISGVKNYDQAMGALNATVGAGDQTMQDLADAIGTGVLSVVKGFGVTLADTSAALAVFGDLNIRGAQAGTDLRMSVQALASPAEKGAANLHALGMSTKTLGQDMQQGGLNQALVDLTTRLNKAGITGSKVGQWLTDTFGKKAGVGLNILIGNLGLLEDAYKTVNDAQNNFSEDVAANNKTLSQKWDQFTAGLQAGAIKVGQTLTPIAEDGLHAVSVLGSGVSAFGHSLAGMKSQLEGVALTAGVLWASFRGAPALVGLASRALYELRFNALVAKEALAGLGGGSAILGATMAGVAAGGAFLLTNGLLSYFKGAHQAQQATEQINTTLAQTPLSVAAYGSAIDSIKAKLAGLNPKVSGVRGVLGLFTGSSQNADAQIDKYSTELKKLEAGQDQAETRNKILAQQLSPGKGPFGAFGTDPVAYKKNLATINEMTAAGYKFSGTFDQAKTQVQAFASTVGTSLPGQAAMANLLKVQGDSASSAADQVNALVQAMQALAGTNQTVLGDQIAAVGAIDGLGTAIDKTSRSLDVNSAAGRTNLSAINDAAGAIEKYAQDQLQAGTPVDQVNQTLYQQAMALEQAGIKAGFNKDEIDQLIQKLLAMPPAKATKVSTPGAATAKGQVDALNRALANIQGQRTINLNLVSNASSVLGSIQSMINNLNPNIPLTIQGYGNLSKLTDPHFQADGGLLIGPGGPRDDKIPVMASNGEFIVNAAATKANLGLLRSINSQRFAGGGLVGQPVSATAYPVGGNVQVIFNVSTPNAQSFRQWLNGPGVVGELVDAVDRHVARGSDVPDWLKKGR